MPRTIVFIHGNFVSKRCWDPWVARFERRGYTCVAVAYPGRDAPVEVLRRNVDDPALGALTIERVIDHHVRTIQALPEKPIVIGHSFGGLLTQLMVQRELAAAAVAIGSVPPKGVMPLSWSFYRSLWPVVNPFIPASRNYLMPFDHFRYTFVNDLPLPEQRAAYETYVVPESRRLGRGGLSNAARIDFERPHAPLLFVASEKDHIMPASLNRKNHGRYRASAPSITHYKEFAGRAHHSIIGGKGWEDVADYALEWAARVTKSEAEQPRPGSAQETAPARPRASTRREAARPGSAGSVHGPNGSSPGTSGR